MNAYTSRCTGSARAKSQHGAAPRRAGRPKPADRANASTRSERQAAGVPEWPAPEAFRRRIRQGVLAMLTSARYRRGPFECSTRRQAPGAISDPGPRISCSMTRSGLLCAQRSPRRQEAAAHTWSCGSGRSQPPATGRCHNSRTVEIMRGRRGKPPSRRTLVRPSSIQRAGSGPRACPDRL